MIPEFIGRLPIIYTLDGLNEDMLVQILKEPKNAILKQYQKLLALDEVKLDYEEDALHAVSYTHLSCRHIFCCIMRFHCMNQCGCREDVLCCLIL